MGRLSGRKNPKNPQSGDMELDGMQEDEEGRNSDVPNDVTTIKKGKSRV